MYIEFIKRIISSIILIPIFLYVIIEGSFLFNFFILICFFITSYEWHMMSKKNSFHIIGFIFIILSFYLIYNLRNDFFNKHIYFLIVTIICVSTDIGGYVFGKVFKGPKLTKISPNKTYAGTIGGYIFSFAFMSLFLSSDYISTEINYLNINVIIFIFLVSTVSQLGDITISYFKRLSKIKDTGKIIPGHGGLLDRIDGMIFAFPFSYLVLKFNIFNFI